RVSPELVFDQGLGDLFVVRTAGNVADPVALGSIEYAIAHLHPSLLVVLGHEKCGAVAAAAAGGGDLGPNLGAIVAKIDPALAPLRRSATGDMLVAEGVRANVRQSARDLLANSAVIRDAVRSGRVKIVEA